MSIDISIHDVVYIEPHTPGTMGGPLNLTIHTKSGPVYEVTLFIGAILAGHLGHAIKSAYVGVKHPEADVDPPVVGAS